MRLPQILTLAALAAAAAVERADAREPTLTSPRPESAQRTRESHSPAATRPDTGRAAAIAPDRIVMTASQGARAEIELGRLGALRSDRDEVREFARRMITDHIALSNSLTQLADRRGWTVAADPHDTHRGELARLRNVSDADFDREYMTVMVREHQRLLRSLEQFERAVRDAELRAWISRTVPTVRGHEEMAREVAMRVGVRMPVAERPGTSGRSRR